MSAISMADCSDKNEFRIYVKKAYPGVDYQIKIGHGHMSYSCECTEEYINELKRILS